jgi:hypothetical protein
MHEDQFSPPADLQAQLDRDYLLSVTRLVAGRTREPLAFVMELDGLLDAPVEQRVDRFRALLASFEGRLSAPQRPSDEDSGAVFI